MKLLWLTILGLSAVGWGQSFATAGAANFSAFVGRQRGDLALRGEALGDAGIVLAGDTASGVRPLIPHAFLDGLLPVGPVAPSCGPIAREGGWPRVSEEGAVFLAWPEDRRLAQDAAPRFALATVAGIGQRAAAANDHRDVVVDGERGRAANPWGHVLEGSGLTVFEAGFADALQLGGGHARHLQKQVDAAKFLSRSLPEKYRERISGPLSGPCRDPGQRCDVLFLGTSRRRLDGFIRIVGERGARRNRGCDQ